MASQVIREFITRWGFDTDTAPLEEMDALAANLKRGLLAVGAAAAAAVGGAVYLASNFESQLTKAARVTNDFERALVEFEQAAFEAGLASAFSAQEAAEALEGLARAGFSITESQEALVPLLNMAAAEEMSLAAATDIVSAAINGFGLEAEEAARVSDVFASASANSATTIKDIGQAMGRAAPTASAMGLELEEVTAVMSGFASVGITGSRAGTSFNATVRELIKASGSLGVNLDLATFEAEGFAGALEMMVDAGLDAQTAQDLIGTEALPAVQALLAQGSGSLSEFSEMLSESGGTAEDMAAKQLATLNGALKIITGTLETLAIRAGKTLLPLGTDIVQALQGSIEASNDLFDDAIGGLESFANFAQSAFNRTSNFVSSTVEALGGLERVLRIVSFAMASVVTFGVVVTLLKMPAIIGAMAASFMRLATAAGLANAALLTKALIITALLMIIGLLVDDFMAFFNGQESAIGVLLQEYPKLGATILALVDTAIELTKAFGDFFEFVLTGNSDWDNDVSNLGVSIGNYLFDTVQFWKDLFSDFWTWVKAQPGAFVDSIRNMSDDVKEIFFEIIDDIIEKFMSIPGAEMIVDSLRGDDPPGGGAMAMVPGPIRGAMGMAGDGLEAVTGFDFMGATNAGDDARGAAARGGRSYSYRGGDMDIHQRPGESAEELARRIREQERAEYERRLRETDDAFDDAAEY